ncbi:MAG: PocR ligand-binding domain-containing protein [Thermodesulfobacteriota bacterium]
MKLTDLLPVEKWIEFEKEIHRRSGLDSNVFDINGYRITGHKQWVNRLCPVVKDSDKGQSFICAVAHMNIAAQAQREKQAVIEACDAGLVKMVVPIFCGNEFLGAVGACGLLAEDGEIDGFMINRTIGLDENEIERLSRDIGMISMSKLTELATYIQAGIDAVIQNRC